MHRVHPRRLRSGFAKSQGISVEQLAVKETPKGLYLVVEKHERGQSAKHVLTLNIPEYLGKLTFPKSHALECLTDKVCPSDSLDGGLIGRSGPQDRICGDPFR